MPPAATWSAGPPVIDVGLAGFDALVLGSAVHDMAWLPSAIDMVRRAASTSDRVWCSASEG